MRNAILLISACLLAMSGCEDSSAKVAGGTPGSLVAGETPVPDFEVKVFEVGSSILLGVGTTGHDGKFQLVRPNGDGPLWLYPGEFAFTLESLGPAAPRLAVVYANATKTPLKVKWNAQVKSLDLKIPAIK